MPPGLKVAKRLEARRPFKTERFCRQHRTSAERAAGGWDRGGALARRAWSGSAAGWKTVLRSMAVAGMRDGLALSVEAARRALDYDQRSAGRRIGRRPRRC